MGRLEIFNYDPASGFEDRIGPMPEKLLEIYRQMDGRPDYKNHRISVEEKSLLLRYLALMPPALGRVFRESCAGLYFIEGLQGNGVTSWVADGKGRLYFHMTLNPASFRQTLSETLTEREQSCFIPEKGWQISVEAGEQYKGLAYALFHEGAHAADYMRGLTPMVEPDQPERYRVPARPDNGLFAGAWAAYSQPAKAYDYAGREKLTFYGFGGGPKIPIREAAGLYRGFSKSPYISLYGSKSWAEDLAELTAYGLITGKLGQPYRITVTGPDGSKHTSEPAKGPAAARSAAALALLEKI